MNTQDLNIGKLNSIWAIATHPNTPVNEARTASMKFTRMLSDTSLSNRAVRFDTTWLKNESNNSPSQGEKNSDSKTINDLNRQLERLERNNRAMMHAFEAREKDQKKQYDDEKLRNEKLTQELKEKAAELNAYYQRFDILTQDNKELFDQNINLEAENDGLKDELNQLNTQHISNREETYLSFRTFESKAKSKIGSAYSKSMLAFELNVTTRVLAAWQLIDLAPMEFVRRLESFSDDQCEPGSRAQWSEDEVNKLKEVLCEGLSDLEAARTLSTQFGRRRFEPNVARKRRQLAEKGWKPSSKDRSSSAWSKDDIVYPDVPDLEIDQTQFSQHHAKPRHDTSGKAVP